MSRNDNDVKNTEAEIESIFGRVREVEFEASPYLATRVLARLREERKASRQLWFWRFIAGAALTMGAVAIVMNVSSVRPTADDAVKVAQAYVIHVDFDPSEVAAVQEVEVELPEGVRFYSKSRPHEVASLKKLKLPMNRSLSGRNKLPFVVQSDVIGSRELKVKLFDSEGSLIRERRLTVSFHGTGKTVTL